MLAVLVWSFQLQGRGNMRFEIALITVTNCYRPALRWHDLVAQITPLLGIVRDIVAARRTAEQSPGKMRPKLPRDVRLVWVVRKLQELDMLDQATVDAVRLVRATARPFALLRSR